MWQHDTNTNVQGQLQWLKKSSLNEQYTYQQTPQKSTKGMAAQSTSSHKNEMS